MKRKNSEQPASKVEINTDDIEVSCGPVQPPINIEELLPHILPLAKSEIKDWKKEDVEKAINALRCRASVVIRRTEDKETLRLFNSWDVKWAHYCEQNPEVEKRLDPWYVLFDVRQTSTLNELANALTEFEERLGTDTITVVINLQLYSFATREDAVSFQLFFYGRFRQILRISLFSGNNYREIAPLHVSEPLNKQ
jgi:hypothetical protein